ncbi:hypothetical protein [Gymnodinialimonas sp. 57CJ19]|uniref:hypothetical protein n=1 Tax=Gymnodinialimonas sp. 57CJ19 TaxID=3138498 RepID=UPI00313432EE
MSDIAAHHCLGMARQGRYLLGTVVRMQRRGGTRRENGRAGGEGGGIGHGFAHHQARFHPVASGERRDVPADDDRAGFRRVSHIPFLLFKEVSNV